MSSQNAGYRLDARLLGKCALLLIAGPVSFIGLVLVAKMLGGVFWLTSAFVVGAMCLVVSLILFLKNLGDAISTPTWEEELDRINGESQEAAWRKTFEERPNKSLERGRER